MPNKPKRPTRTKPKGAAKTKLTQEQREEKSHRKQARIFELQARLAGGTYQTHVTPAELAEKWGLAYGYVEKLACEAAARNRALVQTADEIQARQILALESITAKALAYAAKLDALIEEPDDDDDPRPCKKPSLHDKRETVRVSLVALDTATKSIGALSGITDRQRKVDEARQQAQEAVKAAAQGGTTGSRELHVHYAAPPDARPADPPQLAPDEGSPGTPKPG